MAADLTLRSEDGEEAPGKGELTLHGKTKRAVLATVFSSVGLVLGLATLVPGPHMCVTWVFPFVGAFLALRCWWNEAELDRVEGTCPACAEAIAIQGGQLVGDKPLPRRCPRCQAALEVLCPSAGAGAPG